MGTKRKIRKWISNMEKEFEGLEEDRRRKYASTPSDENSKKYQIGKRLTIILYMETGFKKFSPIPNRMAIKMNRCLQETDIPEWITKGKLTLIQKSTPK